MTEIRREMGKTQRQGVYVRTVVRGRGQLLQSVFGGERLTKGMRGAW
jgi:hypothetical protein